MRWQGERVEGKPRHKLLPCQYEQIFIDGEPAWVCCTPNGHVGDLSEHDVTEHEDGTITVSPSILVRGGPDMGEVWHGYLERGVWRDV